MSESVDADVPFAPTVDWWAMTPDERLETLGELRIWVAKLIVAYGHRSVGSIPRCWEQHEGAVRLLDALHRSYLIATHPAQVGEALIGWHHNLTYVREELRTLFGGCACTDTHHAPLTPPSWATDMAEAGKDSDTWQACQDRALAAYRQQVQETAERATDA
ncbi:hypothetical protein [Actinomyces succiniciruminis]|uniref:Uncharacterized protein n=1 Tax=Actinomyces succiniciruminis TaxID=1522002 RepID=A0A1L7RNQ7_9ACTO|nr:hypothetical protein [Actinomyces succiniciruminis]CED91282.1 Hypothetical protein AAM4_1450 [Actinomyces succiniciruminis]